MKSSVDADGRNGSKADIPANRFSVTPAGDLVARGQEAGAGLSEGPQAAAAE